MFHAKRKPDRPLAALILGLLILMMLATVIYKRHFVGEVVMENVAPPTIVVRPGRIVTAQGELVPFSGFDACEPMPNDGCIQLTNERTHAPVTLAMSGGAVVESWRIVRDESQRSGWGAVELHRPDGTPVVFEDKP